MILFVGDGAGEQYMALRHRQCGQPRTKQGIRYVLAPSPFGTLPRSVATWYMLGMLAGRR